MTASPGILWIGRMIFGRNYRVREIELATRVSRSAPVFALDHTDALSGLRPSLADKLRMRLNLLRAPFELLEEGRLSRFHMPVAAATGPLLAETAAALNEKRLKSALERFACAQVYLSTPFFFMPAKSRAYRLHFDVIDNFHDQWGDDRAGSARKAFHREVLRRADTVSASSLQLCDYVRRLADRDAGYVPNGAALAEFAAADGAGIRRKLGLNGRFVLGFIGNHTMPFYGLERIVRAVLAARDTRPELALLVIGPDANRALGLCRGEADGVHVVGPVPPAEVASWFKACDAGVHPYDLRPQTHDAMALNVLEFGAAGKPVLSNPLREFQRLALPHVRFARDDSVEAWAEALVNPATFAAVDHAALQAAMNEFDWDVSARKLRDAMSGGGGHGSP